MDTLQADLAKARTSLDLDRRLPLVPQSASARGVFFNLAREALKRAGLGHTLLVAPELFQARKMFGLHPVRDLLLVYATAGTLLHRDPIEGVATILRGGSPFFADSWLGNRFRKLFSPDPTAALGWIERSRDHLCNYGYWRLERRGSAHVVLHMFNEYVWIDPWQRAGCEGLLLKCGVQGSVEAELDGPFQGRLRIRWG